MHARRARRAWSAARGRTSLAGTRPSSRSAREARRRRPGRETRSPIVVDNLDVVAVRVEDECPVVPRVIDRPLAGPAVVPVAGSRRDAVELVHDRVVAGRERHVDMLRRLAGEENERAGLTDGLNAAERLDRPHAYAGNRGDRLVEPLRGVDVRDANPEVIDLPGSALSSVVHRFGAVAVRVEQERTVVVVAVLGTLARLAVVAVAGTRPRAPELIHELARRSEERHMQAPGHRLLLACLRNGEVAPFREPLARVCPLDADRAQHRLVEPLRRLAVRHTNRHVVEHAGTMSKPLV